MRRFGLTGVKVFLSQGARTVSKLIKMVFNERKRLW